MYQILVIIDSGLTKSNFLFIDLKTALGRIIGLIHFYLGSRVFSNMCLTHWLFPSAAFQSDSVVQMHLHWF